MNEKIKRLAEWGCEVESTMRRMLGDENFYLECVELIPDDIYFTELGQALQSGDVHAAFYSAHTLKGIIANVGLTPLYNKICEIVEPLRAGSMDGLSEKYNQLLLIREELVEILK